MHSQQERYFVAACSSIACLQSLRKMKDDSRNVLALHCQPQQLLASVTEGVQRFQQHLKSHPLIHEPLHATKAAFPKQQVSQRTREATSKKSALLVEDEGVLVAVQVPITF